ncbi:MAG: lamin tail domain-containing protein [Polyangiaceae bacterium]
MGLLATVFVTGGLGCELITAPDRSKIDSNGGGGSTTTAGGGTGGGGTGGTTTTGGGGTTTSVTPCETPADCPDPPNACVDATCDANVCGFKTKADGPLPDQKAGDCKVSQCTAGVPMDVADDTDLPDDGNDCTLDICTEGNASHMDAPADTACGANMLLKCDGAGKCVDCTANDQCGTDTECATWTCDTNVCNQHFTAQGTPLAAQTAGDCQVEQCDGNGSTEYAADNADVPADATVCTNDVCVLGVPSNIPVAANTTCDENSGTICDGSGACVQCILPTDCPGVDDECGVRTCIGGVCGKNFAPQGTLVASQTAGNCEKNVCDGAGAITSVTDDTDLPNDNNACTDDTCSMGAPVFTNKASGTSCGATQVCDGGGQCVGCNVANDCPGVDDECKTRTCVANVCGFSFTAVGTAVAAQTANDCKKNVCDGSGNIINQNDNADLPADDGNQCTDEACAAGVPSHPAKTVNTACSQNGGSFCSAAGACVACNQAAQCPGQDTECQTRTCVANACGFSFQPNGFVTPTQVSGDCKVRQCDGAGAFVQATSNADLPADDGNQCTDEICTAGVPSHPAKAVNTTCSQNGGSFCSAAGTCVECNAAAQCPGSDTDCQARTCNSNTCGVNNQPAGTPTSSQVAGDCKENQCNGSGGVVSANKDADLPADDGNQCTSEVCTAGVASHPAKAVDTACNQNGGSFCSAGGTCVACNTATQCPGTDNECQTRTCSANACGFNFQPNGTAVAAQTAGDCQENQCNGSGSIVSVAKNSDLPVDGNQCTNDLCTAGAPSNPNLAGGTSCNQNGGTVCNGTGTCVSAACNDGFKDGDETDVDCGGSCASKCALTKTCNGNADCASNACAGGVCVECLTAASCPGTDNECQTRTCNSNTCGMTFQPNGTVVATQTAGDCQENQCNGSGAVVSVAKNTDVPADDGNQCTNDTCSAGAPVHPPKAVDTACSQNGGSFCSAGGTCVACNTATQCPGTDNACQTRTCNSNACGFNFQPNGTVIASQTAGDCQENQCNGSGAIVSVAKNTDVPADDGNQCTDDTCSAGAPVHPAKAVNTACSQNGGAFCSAAATCVQCNLASQCSGTDNECQTRTCSSNTCGFNFQPSGTVVATQTTGDCQENQCNGSGTVVSVAKNSDLPVDGNQCTGDVCTNGVPTNPDLPLGTSCSQNGGTTCNGTGSCVSAACNDGVKNGSETDVDCGGSCAPCALTKACSVNGDCASAACAGNVCVECLSAAQCPGTDNACQTRTCNSNTCGFNFQPAGTVIASQTAGDCQENQCNGSGSIVSVAKNTDVPADDGNQCTDDVCSAGAPDHPAKVADTACSQNGGSFCDGTGSCVACNTAAQCPGSDTECQTRTCSAHACGFNFQPAGTAVASQTAGDCQENQCNGSGAIVSVAKNTDVPADDGNQCTDDTCSAGAPVHPAKAVDTACSQSGGSFCDGAGSCVACNTASQCAGTDTECQTRTCAAHACGFSFTANGTPTASQAAGDCQENQCNGAGSIVSVAKNTDLPADDGFECTDEVCVLGVPSHPNKAVDTTCSQGGGTVCNGAGACVACNVASQCGANTECVTQACTVAGACNPSFTAAGTPVASQTTGDCKENQCNGAGAIVASNHDTDLPVDGNECTNDVCTNGVATNPAYPLGTVCSQNGGTECNGSGACVTPPNVTSTTPADNATPTASPSIVINFSKAMNVGTVGGQAAAGACSGSVQVSLDNFTSCVALSAVAWSNGNTTATLTAAPGLLVNRSYKIRVTTAATDSSNVPLAAQFTQANGFTPQSPNLCSGSTVVISQVYGAGGNSGATYNRDFVELHNRGASAQSLTGWAVQYASAAGNTWTATALSGSIPAGGYYLVGLGNTGTGSALPGTDVVNTSVSMGSTQGKVALTNTTTALSGTCPSGGTIVDFVGYGEIAGTTGHCFEGVTGTLAPSITNSAMRVQACMDNNNNAGDFFAPLVSPRWSGSATTSCSCTVVNESGSSSEADYCNVQSPTSLNVAASTSTGTVYGQIYEAGTTEAAGANANVVAQLGYGTPSVNPEYETFTWTSATYNVQSGNNDEYQSSFKTPATSGSYRYVYRFSLDNGATWTVCDRGSDTGAGSNAGLSFELADEPVLTVP